MVDTKKPRSRKKAPPPEVVAEDAPPLSRPRRILRWIGRGLAGIGAFYLLLILLFSFLPPPINLYQISESWRLGGISKDWVSWDEIAPVMGRSAVARIACLQPDTRLNSPPRINPVYAPASKVRYTGEPERPAACTGDQRYRYRGTRHQRRGRRARCQ